jgi:PAS domain S-box-containing protein
LASTETTVGSDHVPRTVGAAAEAVVGADGDRRRLQAIFERRPVPMVMVDDERRFVDVNRPARLVFRLSLDELRAYAMDDFAHANGLGIMESVWARLLDTGCVAGRYRAEMPDGSCIDLAYCAVAYVLPGLHVVAFAPADWPDDELGAIEGAPPDSGLTPREIEVLALAADGLSGPELAQALVLSATTVNTHFKNIYVKLGVRNRAAAVAKAMRLGVIY